MPLFSERYNLIEKTKLQKSSLNRETRNLLWNELWKLNEGAYEACFLTYAEFIWCNYLKQCSDEFPYNKHYLSGRIPDFSFLKEMILNGEWYEVYDLLELASKNSKIKFEQNCNEIFIRENCAYRFVDKYITEIISDIEIQEIEEAINSSDRNITLQLKQALEHLSDRQNPDYRNSIKESISAVETLCRNITGESTLDRALNKLKTKGVVFNSELEKGLEKIYYYTNGENGIRHALMNESNTTKADAKFMLVVCSAFINYIKEKEING